MEWLDQILGYTKQAAEIYVDVAPTVSGAANEQIRAKVDAERIAKEQEEKRKKTQQVVLISLIVAVIVAIIIYIFWLKSK